MHHSVQQDHCLTAVSAAAPSAPLHSSRQGWAIQIHMYTYIYTANMYSGSDIRIILCPVSILVLILIQTCQLLPGQVLISHLPDCFIVSIFSQLLGGGRQCAGMPGRRQSAVRQCGPASLYGSVQIHRQCRPVGRLFSPDPPSGIHVYTRIYGHTRHRRPECAGG